MSAMLKERRTKERRILTIGAAAAELGVSASWLRLAERLGVVPPARRTPGGQRRYTPEDIQQLRGLGVGTRPQKLKRVGDVLETLR